MSSPPARALTSVPTGNTFDKYGSRNPLVRCLMEAFRGAVADLLDAAAPDSILDLGCGEGVLTAEWAERLPSARVVGIDLPDARLEQEWRLRRRPNLQFMAGTGEALPFASGEFDLVAAVEALEHVPHPERVLDEMSRVAGRHLLVSVPREPLWRVLNLARGAYVGRLGDTPGHLNHWSKRGLLQLLGSYGQVVELRAPVPWAMALVRVG